MGALFLTAPWTVADRVPLGTRDPPAESVLVVPYALVEDTSVLRDCGTTYPQYPLIVNMRNAAGEGLFPGLIYLSQVLVENGADAILHNGSSMDDAIASLRSTRHVSVRVANWILTRNDGSALGEGALVLRAFLLASQHTTTVADAALELGLPARRLRDLLRRSGYPPPKQWLGLVLALQRALHLQNATGDSLTRCALTLGYPDHAAMCRATRTYFGLRPSEVRECVGINRLLHRWWNRQHRGR